MARPTSIPADDDSTPRMPTRIGRYAIQRVLGSGGMATVYAALQEQPRRTVALKVMRPGIVSRHTERRFRHEMEILAKLRHPFIAQIFDAGTHDDGGGGVPYFVMEYISQAQTLTDYADAKKLDLRERLKLFVKVCSAVQHGHAARIVHRDLKPGNVLVDAKGDPKIIDFGVARVTEMDFGAQTQHTEAGRLVGTVAYMSPEQVAATGADIGPATDVYALGVTLYKLLCGRMPHSLTGLPLHEAVRVIREDAPIRPSTIRPELRGDVETILMTALEKNPSRRYGTAGDLGRDILRFLGDQPIRARPAGIVYRARLFAKRHRTAVFAASVMGFAIATLGAGGGWLWWQYREIGRQWAQIEAEGQVQARLRRAEIADGLEPQAGETRRRTFLTGHRSAVTDISFSTDGGRVATIDRGGTVIVWELPGGRRRQQLDGVENRASIVALDGVGDAIVVGADDGMVSLYSVADGRQLSHRRTHSDGVLCLATAGERIATGGADMTIRLWQRNDSEASSNPEPSVLRGSDGPFTALAFAGDGAAIVAGTERGRIVTYTVEPPARLATSVLGASPVVRLAVGPEPSLVLAGLASGQVVLLEISADGSAAPRWSIPAHDGEVAGASIHHSGRTIATAGNDGVVRILQTSGGEPLDEWISLRPGHEPGLTVAMPISSAAFTPAGDWLMIGAEDGLITLLPVDAATGRLLSTEP